MQELQSVAYRPNDAAGLGRRRSAWRIKLTALGLAMTIGLIVMEVALRIIIPKPMPPASADVPKAEYYGWALPPSQTLSLRDPDRGVLIPFTTNAEGWKDRPRVKTKPPGVRRIILLGDSNTYGITAIEHQYGVILETLLNDETQNSEARARTEVISIGVPGWGTDQCWEALCREGMQYQPDLVIYQFCANDLTDNLYPGPREGLAAPNAMHRHKDFGYRLTESGTLIREEKVPARQRMNRDRTEWKTPGWGSSSALWSALETLVKRTKRQYGTGDAQSDDPITPEDRQRIDPLSPYFCYAVASSDPPGTREAWTLMRAFLQAMRDHCRERGVAFWVISESCEPAQRSWYLDHGLMVRQEQEGAADLMKAGDGTWRPCNFDRPREELARTCRVLGIPFVPNQRPYPRYQNDAHPNPDGNRALADDIADAVRTRFAHTPAQIAAESEKSSSQR